MSIVADSQSKHPSLSPPIPSLSASVPQPIVGATCSDEPSASFADRRAVQTDAGLAERRQFASSHSDLSPEARELAFAIDRYKLEFRRRYITCEEMLAVVKQLGYHLD